MIETLSKGFLIFKVQYMNQLRRQTPTHFMSSHHLTIIIINDK